MAESIETLEEEEEDTMEGKFLSFPLNNVLYGIAIRYVTEVIRFQEITSVPHMPSFVKGVINLRGRVIPVMDVRLRFLLPERAYDDRTCIVVVNMEGTSVGLIVDTVSGVVPIPKEQVEPPPRARKSNEARFISGMGKLGTRVTILLEVSKLLEEKELGQLQEAAA